MTSLLARSSGPMKSSAPLAQAAWARCTAPAIPAESYRCHQSLAVRARIRSRSPLSNRPIPTALDHLVRVCLEKDPGRRWQSPVWVPERGSIVFSANAESVAELYSISADGSGEPTMLFRSSYSKYPTSWSAANKLLAYTEFTPATQSDIWLLDLSGPPKAEPWLTTRFQEAPPTFRRTDDGSRSSRMKAAGSKCPSGRCEKAPSWQCPPLAECSRGGRATSSTFITSRARS